MAVHSTAKAKQGSALHRMAMAKKARFCKAMA
uniref:Uncharacterized protein n=1 Tax=Ackermannviridae sp. TaxID=2831612 RepID=A0A8S5VJT9_9CAUD|nr:MAG TPA: hypothetical protein [Ackermannviridae sp.]